VLVEVLATVVIDGRRPGIGMAGSDLDVPQGDPASSAHMMKAARSMCG
jgi:hypothetical protein